MRALTIVCLVLLVGCNDHLRVDSFAGNPDGTFIYGARTNTVMTENDDGEAEQIRRDWLAEEVTGHEMCPAGYVVEIRRLLPAPEPPPSNAHDVLYTGRCL